MFSSATILVGDAWYVGIEFVSEQLLNRSDLDGYGLRARWRNPSSFGIHCLTSDRWSRHNRPRDRHRQLYCANVSIRALRKGASRSSCLLGSSLHWRRDRPGGEPPFPPTQVTKAYSLSTGLILAFNTSLAPSRGVHPSLSSSFSLSLSSSLYMDFPNHLAGSPPEAARKRQSKSFAPFSIVNVTILSSSNRLRLSVRPSLSTDEPAHKSSPGCSKMGNSRLVAVSYLPGSGCS